MIGDIGEAIAAIQYGVEIDKKLTKHWDGMLKGEFVQVKTTQKDDSYLKEPPREGILMVFKISEDGTWESVYIGSIKKVWRELVRQNPNGVGEKIFSLNRLRKIK